MFGKILAYAASQTSPDPAVEQAAVLAERTGARLEIVDVVGTLPVLSVDLEDIRSRIREQRAERLEKLAAGLPDEGTGVSTRLLAGRPSVAIGRHILGRKHDLLVVSADRDDRNAIREARRLLRVCPCPVWIVRRPRGRLASRVLATIEPSHEGTEPAKLNDRVLAFTKTLADTYGGSVHVVSSWAVDDEEEFGGILPTAAYSEFRKGLRDDARELIEPFLRFSDLELPEDHLHLVGKRPGDAIIDAATQREADLIVMGTIARRGLAGLLLGNTAEAVLRRSPCSLVVVKHDGFVSPLSDH